MMKALSTKEVSIGHPQKTIAAPLPDKEAFNIKMPHPGNLYDKTWGRSLVPFLEQRVMARFDQNMCTNNHGFEARPMCFGLSLNWVKKLEKEGGDLASRDGSIDRMSHFASFDGVVNARTVQNFYTTEHLFNYDIAKQDEAKKRMAPQADVLAGSNAMTEAAQVMSNSDLKAKLDFTEGCPFMLTADYTYPRAKIDPKALEIVTNAIVDNKSGVLTVFDTESAHAIAFSLLEDNASVLFFDPNHGEFKASISDIAGMIAALGKESDMHLIHGMQIHAK